MTNAFGEIGSSKDAFQIMVSGLGYKNGYILRTSKSNQMAFKSVLLFFFSCLDIVVIRIPKAIYYNNK